MYQHIFIYEIMTLLRTEASSFNLSVFLKDFMFHESYYLQICERYVKKHKIDVYTPGKINH